MFEALDRQDDERRAYLDAVCGDDDTLRRDAEALLAQEQATEGFLATPATLDATLLRRR
ncbi:MAG: hypothetical protein HC897_13130, partial [Thermoanaerobaculia bacterium]|nr:hypothetical protein [Thermoanaerobaculia bacterium]